MLRRTKIVATLGPSTDGSERIESLIDAGINVVRVNFSHGSLQEHIRRIKEVQSCALKKGKPLGVLADLQGPKIRLACFEQGSAFLEKGQEFIIDAAYPKNKGNVHCIGVDYLGLPKDVQAGDLLLIDDGRVELLIKKVEGNRIFSTVIRPGKVTDHKGINLRGGGLSTGAITDKDKKDLQAAISLNVHYVALSFTRNAQDIQEARKLMGKEGKYIRIIAKIERTEAVESIDEIIEAADGIMIARGDLGVEVGEAEVPGIQKDIITKARHAKKPVITATQMMESMILNSVPTRAEVSDVANAVLDGTDAVMLSAETAVGKYPKQVIKSVSEICLAAEKRACMLQSKHRVDTQFERADEAIAMAAMYIANHMPIRAIIALTESGTTPLYMSRIDSGIPIYGLSRHRNTINRMALYRGVYPLYFDGSSVDRKHLNRSAVDCLNDLYPLNCDDLLIITKGDAIGKHGGSNAIKLLKF